MAHITAGTARRGWGWDVASSRVALAAIILTAGMAVVPAQHGEAGSSVIVRYVPGALDVAADAVRAVGGTIVRSLDIIGGFEATVPSGAVDPLRRTHGVVSVHPNGRLKLLSELGYAPASELGSMYNVARMVGAPSMWSRGVTGAGVDVALIDSGVAPVAGLDGAGKVVVGPDLSFDSPAANLRSLDTFGHGTHMAGIIAGRDGDAVAPYSDPSKFVGVAPDARLLSVKVAAADGSTDVSQVIAAIDWVVQHRNDNGLNVRVLNLSFGTDGTQSYLLDPLAYAAEVAWRKGIVVVASAGNGGQSATSLTNPAFDPYVVAVGASDPQGTETTNDDTVASFSSRGNAARHADVVAPGKSVISLRVPNSFIDDYAPGGRVGTRFFRGSGTSQAAAVTSGVVALMLQQRPGLSPDQVKSILMSSAYGLKNQDPVTAPAGIVDASRARTAPPQVTVAQAYPQSRGTGTLEGARGGYHVTDDGVALTGERDIFGKAFDSSAWAPASLAGSTWSGGDWNGSTWSGSTWSGSTWSGSTWSGSTWSGHTWSGSTWSGSTWSGHTWSGSTWSGSTWSGSTWSGSTWSGSTWSGSTWSGGIWPGSTWSTASWGA